MRPVLCGRGTCTTARQVALALPVLFELSAIRCVPLASPVPFLNEEQRLRSGARLAGNSRCSVCSVSAGRPWLCQCVWAVGRCCVPMPVTRLRRQNGWTSGRTFVCRSRLPSRKSLTDNSMPCRRGTNEPWKRRSCRGCSINPRPRRKRSSDCDQIHWPSSSCAQGACVPCIMLKERKLSSSSSGEKSVTN